MDSKHTAETWLFYGVCDLYFSFHTEDFTFDCHSAFSGIMALEKHLKGALLLRRGDEYSSLQENKAKSKVQSIAKGYGHDFEKMISSCNDYFGGNALGDLVSQDYDGYKGSELVKVLGDSYMETRYPATIQVSSSFPVGKKEGIYYNPLSSPGLHHFIFAICEFVVVTLSPAIDVQKLLSNVTQQYNHLESFSRFRDVYLSGYWQKK